VKPADLRILVQEGEGTTLEFKENLPASLARDLVAMANTIGGKILLGVRDDGTVAGVKDSNNLRARIQDIARNCDPPVKVVVEPVGGVLVIHVRESDAKPVQCGEGFFWRQGAVTQKLSRDEIRDFFRAEGSIRFDLSPCPRFRYPQDFDRAKFNAWLKLSGITGRPRTEDVLVNIEAAERTGGKLFFRNAGVLFFAKNVRHFFNQAYITCLLAKGTDKVHILDRKDFDGGVVADIEDALRFIERNTRLAYRIERLQRENIPEYPMRALREAITNAVMHRDWFIEGANVFVEIYDDRIEVVSPGGLPKGMTLADLGRKSVRRNALIADLLHRISFIEKAGTGVKRIRDEAREGGYPEPVWEANGFVTTVFRPSPAVRAMVAEQAGDVTRQGAAHVPHMYRTSPGHVAVLEATRDPRSREELQRVAGIRHRQHFLLEYLRPLLDAGLIELTIPDKPRSSKQRYRLTAAGIAYLSGLEEKKPTKKGRGE
jgi:ATP-dependent DNA helicase RecG